MVLSKFLSKKILKKIFLSLTPPPSKKAYFREIGGGVRQRLLRYINIYRGTITIYYNGVLNLIITG